MICRASKSMMMNSSAGIKAHSINALLFTYSVCNAQCNQCLSHIKKSFTLIQRSKGSNIIDLLWYRK